jgi:hypothetical protein
VLHRGDRRNEIEPIPHHTHPHTGARKFPRGFTPGFQEAASGSNITQQHHATRISRQHKAGHDHAGRHRREPRKTFRRINIAEQKSVRRDQSSTDEAVDEQRISSDKALHRSRLKRHCVRLHSSRSTHKCCTQVAVQTQNRIFYEQALLSLMERWYKPI